MASEPKVILRALTRIQNINGGEVFGLPERQAEDLIARGVAVRHEQGSEPHEASDVQDVPGPSDTPLNVTRDVDPGPGPRRKRRKS